jgi:hypothetical protein
MQQRAADAEEWKMSTELNINRVMAVAYRGNDRPSTPTSSH